jgi:membrane fusion protein (multidrug efflux system)
MAESLSDASVVAAPGKATKARIVLVAAFLGIAGWVGYHAWHARHFVETDNAQVEGHIIPIAARVSGYVRALPVADNQLAPAGGVLVKIDDRDYLARFAQADADLRVAMAAAGGHDGAGQMAAQVAYSQAVAAAAQASVAQAEANVERTRNDLERIRSLATRGMASAAQLDAAEAAARSAVSQLKTAQDTAKAAGQQVGVSSAGLKSAQAKVDSVRAQRELAAIQLADTQVTAPTAGLVSKRAVEIGQFVQPGQTLMYLVPTDDLWVVANLKETEVGRIRVGQQVALEVDAYPGRTFTGRVDSFSAATGSRFALLPPDNASGNFTKVVQRVPVKVRLDPFDARVTPLRPGMSVTASVRID